MKRLFIAMFIGGIAMSLYANQSKKISMNTLDVKTSERWHNHGSIVIDMKLGLMWQDDARAKTVKKTWSGAREYCTHLTINGYSDWQLPSYNALLSIVDYDRYDSTIVPIFQHIIADEYWSDSQDVQDSAFGWNLNFKDGSTYSNHRSTAHYVRCVRYEPIPSEHSNTVHLGKLEWQDDIQVRRIERDWSGARAYCKALSLEGHHDWRLPRLIELQSIVDIDRSMTSVKNLFHNTASVIYWTDSECIQDHTSVWTVFFFRGYSGCVAKSYKRGYVRCVRDIP